MSTRTIFELELNGRGQGWTDLSSDLTTRTVSIKHGISGSGVNDHTAGTGTAKFALVNQDSAGVVGKYSFNNANRLAGFALGIGVRFRVITNNPAGTGTGYQINNAAGYPAGTKTVLVDTGTGSIERDDIVTFAGVAGEYLVRVGGSSPTSLEFEPGLAGAVADNAAVTLVKRNHTRHFGRLNAANPIPGIYGARTVQCTSVDWMDDAARSKVSGLPIQLGKRADEIFQAVVTSVPFQPEAIEADESPDTYAFALDTTQDEKTAVLSELNKIALSEFGYIYVKADGTVTFESRNRRALSENVIDTFADTATLSGFSAPIGRGDAISKVKVTTHPRKVDAGDTTLLFRLDSSIEIPAQSTVTLFAPYRDPEQEAARVGGVDMQTPAAGTDYQANGNEDGSGTDLTLFIQLTPTFTGNGASIQAKNIGTTNAWLTKLELKGRGIYDYQHVVLEAEDADAQINLGSTQTADMPYQDNAGVGQEVAQWLVALYENVETQAKSATIFIPRTDEALADRVLNREISDRVGIVEEVTGFDPATTGGSFIQNIQVDIDQRDNLRVTWGLAPANRTLFWLLEVTGRSELDQTTYLGYGLFVGHTDQAHADIHDDAAHVDTAHDDTHGDVPHGDAAHSDQGHVDSHDDVAHSDVSHSDSHDDTAHEDVSHQDSHSDVSHQDTHSDQAFQDTHFDNHEDHTDGVHTDIHSDHDDVTVHQDSHTDTAHSDSHQDRAHEDAHDDEHSDVSHQDVNHDDMHGDSTHGDAAHDDVTFVDTHTDVAHGDVAHGDSHQDTAHGDQN